MFSILQHMIVWQLIKPKQIIVSILIVIFIALVISFQAAISAYRIATLDELKGIYPSVFYNRTGADIVHPEGLNSRDEIFNFSVNVRFRYQASGDIVKLPDIGVRSYTDEHLPKILQNEENHQYIYLSQSLFNRVSRSNAFDGKGVYFGSKDDTWPYFEIKPFATDSFWLVLSNRLALKIFRLADFSNVTLYGDTTEEMRSWYANQGVLIEYWYERLPLFGRLFYHLLENFSKVFFISYLILLILLTIMVVGDILSEYKMLLKNAAFYTYPLFGLILGLCGFIISYSIIITFFGYWGAKLLYSHISVYVPLLLHNAVTFEWLWLLGFIILEIIFISVFSFYHYKDINVLDD